MDTLATTPTSDEAVTARARAAAIGELLLAGRVADLDPEALRWYVDRAERLDRRLGRLVVEARDMAAQAAQTLAG